MIYLTTLAVFSGLSINLLLQFALGTTGIVSDQASKSTEKKQLPVFQFIILFVTILLLWVFFEYILPSGWKSFYTYFLFFPLSALSCIGLEFIAERIFPSAAGKKLYTARTAYDGLAPASVLLTNAAAGNFAEAAVTALFFVLGNMMAMIILNEIRRRAAMERVPAFLRGSPLVIISMGLLSLVSLTAAGICFTILYAL